MRQWVLSVPARLRYFMQHGGAELNLVLLIFLRAIAQSLPANSRHTELVRIRLSAALAKISCKKKSNL